MWRLHGEKWFCSVADADLYLVTARPQGAPDGTRGIGCFLVASADGGFRIRKLKDKLGTRALATGEIEFEGAVAYPLGPLEDGFRIAVSVLNTSRWLNAVGSCGLMRRATRVATEFAAEREAFGRAIVEFPLVRENLAVMKAETDGALASTAEVTRLVDLIDRGEASDEDVVWHRVLVNANKFVTSLAGTKLVTARDRDARRERDDRGLLAAAAALPRRDRVRELGGDAQRALRPGAPRPRAVRRSRARRGAERRGRPTGLRRSVQDPAWGALHGRRQLDRVVRSLQVAALRDSEPGERGAPGAPPPDAGLAA